MASRNQTTRRSLFAIAGAAALVPAAAYAVATTDNGARLLQLERQWNALNQFAEQAVTDDEVDTASAAMVPIEIEIAEAPCRCGDAFLVKLRTVVKTGLTQGQLFAIDDDALITGMIAFMEGRN